MLIAVNFHYIRPSFEAPYPSIFGKTPDQFEQQISLYQKLGKPVSGNLIRDHIRDIHELPEKSMMITFDDGLKEQYQYALPVLEKLNTPALFFINTRTLVEPVVLTVHKTHLIRSVMSTNQLLSALISHFEETYQVTSILETLSAKGVNQYKYDDQNIASLKYILNFILNPEELDFFINELFNQYFKGEEKQIHASLYMNKDEIADLCKKGYIGTHGHDHLTIGMLDHKQKEFQIGRSVDILKDLFNYQPAAISYPYGSKEASSGLSEILKQNNITFGFTLERAMNHHFELPFQLARFDNNDLPLGKAYKYNNHNIFDLFPKRDWVLS